MKNMWMVRAGKDAFLIDEFKNRNIAVIGWGIGDVADLTEEEIKERLREKNPNKSERSIGKWEKMIYDFRSTIEKGDYVLTATKSSKKYLLGVFKSDYYFCEDLINEGIDEYRIYNNFRDVEWMCEIPSEKLSKETKKTLLGQPITLFPIRDLVKDELLSFIDINPPFVNDLKRNIIYFGAPGTGKSYNLNNDKNNLLLDKNDYERVTFHPDYSYANFVGTYKPFVPKEDSISYKYVPGPFMRTLVKALKNPDKPFLLIIEEINRANVAAVFGDVFQLLDRDKNQESKFPIETTEDMRIYLDEAFKDAIEKDKDLKDYITFMLNEDYSKIKIPSNMFIWATMNSADQGVFPMDTAFKRRWDFKYFGINDEKEIIKDIKVNLNDQEISWNDIREAINNELLTYKINEDKLLGPFFAFNEYIDGEKERDDDEFKEIFKNKIIMYLFEDVARAKRDILFAGVKEKNKGKSVIYSDICEMFDDEELKIFTDDIKNELKISK